MLGRVADGITHVVQAAAVDQIDDELEFVQALEVRDLRLIASFDQRLEPGLDQGADAAAENRLLAEEIRLGLFRERRLDDTGARDADGLAVGQGQLAGLAAHVLVHRDQRRRASTLDKELTNAMSRRFRRNHRHVDILRRHHPSEADVEAVGEHQRLALLQVGLDRFLVELRLGRVRHEHHDDVSPLADLRRRADLEPGGFGRGLRLAALVQADANVDAAVLQLRACACPCDP